MSLFSPQTWFCMACGERQFSPPATSFYGRKTCGKECHSEMALREAASTLGHTYEAQLKVPQPESLRAAEAQRDAAQVLAQDLIAGVCRIHDSDPRYDHGCEACDGRVARENAQAEIARLKAAHMDVSSIAMGQTARLAALSMENSQLRDVVNAARVLDEVQDSETKPPGWARLFMEARENLRTALHRLAKDAPAEMHRDEVCPKHGIEISRCGCGQ